MFTPNAEAKQDDKLHATKNFFFGNTLLVRPDSA